MTHTRTLAALLASAALALAATLGAIAPAHANPSGIPNPGVSYRVTQVQTKNLIVYPWGCRVATRERDGVKTPLGRAHWNPWSVWHVDGPCAVALPASASISGNEAAALPQGATRYVVQQAAGTGCHVSDSSSDGAEHLRKLYKVEGSLWLVVSYAKTFGQGHFHLTSKAIGNDLQLLGARCS